MRERSVGSHDSLVLAVASMTALLVIAVLVLDLFADHALGTESQVAWRAQLRKVDAAVAGNDLADAATPWREAYAVALKSRHWEGMVAVGDAYRQLGDLGGFPRTAQAKARQTYLTAMFRARGEASVDGVLRVADRFADLGDHDVVKQCIRVARSIATQARDPHAQQSVRAFAERWEARALEGEPRRFTP